MTYETFLKAFEGKALNSMQLKLHFTSLSQSEINSFVRKATARGDLEFRNSGRLYRPNTEITESSLWIEIGVSGDEVRVETNGEYVVVFEKEVELCDSHNCDMMGCGSVHPHVLAYFKIGRGVQSIF